MKPKTEYRTGTGSRAFIALLLLFSMVLSLFPTSAFAWIIGDSNDIVGDTSSATGGYYLSTSTNTMGFRFTLVDANGTRVTGTASIDIYEDSNISSYLPSSATICRFMTKRSKMQLIKNDAYKSVSVTMETPLGWTDSSFYDSDNIKDSAWGLSLPTTASGMTSWLGQDNLDTVMQKAWGYEYGDLADNTWAIAVEPIYAMKVDYVWFLLTVTEIPILAMDDGTAYSSSSPTWTSSVTGASDGGATWKFISSYTHAPSLIRV